jgi:hypothetical protein
VETIALAYLALLVVGAITVGTARRPVLLRGATLLRLNGLFAVVSLLIALADPNQRPPAVTFVAFLGLVTLAVRGRWIVFLRGTPDVLPLIDESLSRLRVSFTRDEDRFAIAGGAALRVSAILPGVRALRFDGDWRERRLSLARSLLAKRFRGPLPELRIRVGGGIA